MEHLISQIFQILQNLTGLHRQLLETVRLERESIVELNLQGIETITQTKQKLIEQIHQTETQRLKITFEISKTLAKPLSEVTLPYLVLQIQTTDSKKAEQLRSLYNALTVLIQRITEQNQENRALLEKSLQHIHEMKKNVLGEAQAKKATYSPQGHKVSPSPGARILSGEA